MTTQNQTTTFRFNSRHLAFAFAGRTVKPYGVMLGDDGRYWVASLADCTRLARMGYEWAR